MEEVIKLYNDYATIKSKAKHKYILICKGLKILTPKQMLVQELLVIKDYQ